jgi:hypothetical protein
MRMLALLAAKPQLLALFQEKCAGSTQQQLDAGGKPARNSGLGMNLNHAYWPKMVHAFNDASEVLDFPYEYVVDQDIPTYHSNGVDRVLPPAKVQHGFFAGLGIKQPRIPQGFDEGFFDVSRLDTIFANGMAEYHNAQTNFHASGQHGKPLWFFITPVRTVVPEDQAMYLDDKMKRWDSLAFHCIHEQIQNVKMHFTKTVPNGVGGAAVGSTPFEAHAVTAGASNRFTASHRQHVQDIQFKQLHEMQMQNLQSKADARVQCEVEVEIGKMDKIMRLQKMANDFQKIGSIDMEERCKSQADTLILELLARDLTQSPLTFKGKGGTTPKTPATPITPSSTITITPKTGTSNGESP